MSDGGSAAGPLFLKVLIFMMFAMFAMTTDSVGAIIPVVIAEFDLGLTAGGAFHYATMTGIGFSAILLGFLADRIGRKITILIGLVLFGASSALFAAGNDFMMFVTLLLVSGIGIGIFKSGALALIGDLSRSTGDHARNMNLVEGFFGVGAIVGPAMVAVLLQEGASWKWLYLISALLCLVLIIGCLVAPFPKTRVRDEDRTNLSDTLRMLRDPHALFFATMLMLYVGAEAAIYVWAPTYLADYDGQFAWLAPFAVSIFFVLRAGGRFFGAWLLSRMDWAVVLVLCTAAITVLFWIAVLGGRGAAVLALPATGLFMSVLYPTINSIGISLFPKTLHGSIAGVLLFFTCVGAVVAPLAMGAAGDIVGNSDYSMALGAVFATLLALMCLYNLLRRPVESKLAERDVQDYGHMERELA